MFSEATLIVLMIGTLLALDMVCTFLMRPKPKTVRVRTYGRPRPEQAPFKG